MTCKQTHTASNGSGGRGHSPAQRSGQLFIISAPSGGGKTTLCRSLRATYPDLRYSVSYTTRPPRPGEKDGKDYHFISSASFETGIRRGRWAEWARVHEHYYGTSAEFIDAQLAAGYDILLDIDVQGTVQLLARYPNSVTIFIMPPSLKALKRRLEARGTDSPDTIARRLKAAKAEIEQKGLYRHVIVNDTLPEATDALKQLITRYRKPSPTPSA